MELEQPRDSSATPSGPASPSAPEPSFPVALAAPLHLLLPGGSAVLVREVGVPPALRPQLNSVALTSELKEIAELRLGLRCYAGRLVAETFAPAQQRLELRWRSVAEASGELLLALRSEATGELLRRAIRTAEEAHRQQVRHDGTPYVLHPLEVALELQQFTSRDEALAAALLHDVVEDGHRTAAQLEELFGSRIARLVGLVTVWRSLGPAGPARDAAYFGPLCQDEDAGRIKCADMLCNLRTLHLLVEDRLRRRLTAKYAPQVEQWLLPWARSRRLVHVAETFERWLASPLAQVDLCHAGSSTSVGGP